MKINYFEKLKIIISQNIKENKSPKLLLHCCCAPCASSSLKVVDKGFKTTAFFYNPNIENNREYNKRANELKRFINEADFLKNVDCIILEYDASEFLNDVKGFESLSEGGKRCEICFKLRLMKTALYAKENGYDYFATTLTLSPLKNAALINKIGKDIEKEVGIKYLETDFKKQDGYLLSIKLSKEYNLYRQNYCGCQFSKNK